VRVFIDVVICHVFFNNITSLKINHWKRDALRKYISEDDIEIFYVCHMCDFHILTKRLSVMMGDIDEKTIPVSNTIKWIEK